MNKIKCVDREISMSDIESMYLISKMYFNHSVDGIDFHQTGEKFFRKHFWSRKKSFDCNMYQWFAWLYLMTCSAETIVDRLKENLYANYINWGKFFVEPILKYQIEWDKEKDCVVRKPTIVIRTKSGDTLYAVYDTDSLANNVIRQFNSSYSK
jgi:hypothetical protein